MMRSAALVAVGLTFGGAVAAGAVDLPDFDAGAGTTLCYDSKGAVVRPTGTTCPARSTPFVVASPGQVDAIETAHNDLENRTAALEETVDALDGDRALAVDVPHVGSGGGGCDIPTSTCLYGLEPVTITNLALVPTPSAPSVDVTGPGVLRWFLNQDECTSAPLAGAGSCTVEVIIEAAEGSPVTITFGAGAGWATSTFLVDSWQLEAVPRPA